MTAMRDEKLEEMLRSRRVEPPSADLAERIILKAQAIPQSQALPLGQSLRRLFAEFHLPKPAYVLAGTLLVGFLLGFNNPFDTTPPVDSVTSPTAQAYLYADEDDL
jgi:hypothetical protein